MTTSRETTQLLYEYIETSKNPLTNVRKVVTKEMLISFDARGW